MPDTHPLAIFGDWHGASGWALTAIRSAAREGVRTAIHVGDFGLDWPGAKRGRYEAKLNKYLMDLGVTLVVSGGNHDNWDTIEKSSKMTVQASVVGVFGVHWWWMLSLHSMSVSMTISDWRADIPP